ncbi:nuclear transport factor 2 family protein [Krasilnikovia sp. MM14-A1259]|uniref:nuclear transport factor 2 family protein n=1 Tax=Krasilnikovia sp. MM14-A1259 TaxID=3373539 RepID=UPI0038124D4C
MTTANTQVARDYIENIWNKGKTEDAAKYIADDLIQHNPNLADGRKPLVEFIDSTRGQLPGLRFDIRRTAAEGDLVFVHSLFLPAAGQRGLAVIDVFRIQDGVIAEHWDLNEAVPETTASGREIV